MVQQHLREGGTHFLTSPLKRESSNRVPEPRWWKPPRPYEWPSPHLLMPPQTEKPQMHLANDGPLCFSSHLMSYGLAGPFSGMPSCCGVIHEFRLIHLRRICFRPSPQPRCLYSDSTIKIRMYLESSHLFGGDAQLWATGHRLTQPFSTAELIQPLGLTQAGSLIKLSVSGSQ